MLNFTVGPVPSNDEVRAIGSLDVPYFRTSEFSSVMLQNESMLLELAYAPKGSRAVFCTSSGSGAMEAVVMGTLDATADKALVVDGGSFGHRFRQMLELHGIPHSAIELDYGSTLSKADLERYSGMGYTAFLVNLGETSQGVLYDADLIASFCKREGMYLVVDGISSFLADPFDMTEMGADILITDAQKALACPPGVAPIVLSPQALERVGRVSQPCMYFDLVSLLSNQDRGQTPFTPAVGILLQINARLRQIIDEGGSSAEVDRCRAVAEDFREKLAQADLPLDMRTGSPSNAVTYITTRGFSAKKLVDELKDSYGIWLCPNGGASADSSFRVGHIGSHPLSDNSLLVAALIDAARRGFMGSIQ